MTLGMPTLVEVPVPTHRPALVEGRMVWLPLLPRLMRGERGFVAAEGRVLRNALLAAALAAPATDRLDGVTDIRELFPDPAA